MKLGFVAAATAVLVLGSIAGASAQGGGRGGRGGGFGGGGGLGLLRIPEVQKELKMTDAQVAKLDGKQDEIRQAMQELFQNAGGGGGGGRGGFGDPAMMQKLQDIQNKAVNDVLDTTQQKRFKELEIQRAGNNAVTRPDVQKDLGMTEDQKTKVKGIQDAQRQAMQDLFQNAGDDRQAAFAKMQEMQKTTGEKLIAVLTDAQKTKLKAMGGAAFKFPEGGFGRPGGGGRPPQPPV